MSEKMNSIFRRFLLVACSLVAAGSISGFSSDTVTKVDSANGVVDFEHSLDDYEPAKKNYNFYFTYKIVHPWWDAVALGMEDAQKKYLEKGIIITYEYMAPDAASYEDQTNRLLHAQADNYDVIGVDVADEDKISPVLDKMMAEGKTGKSAGEGFYKYNK